MRWAILPERYDYPIEEILRGNAQPDDEPTILHYRKRDVLRDAGFIKRADAILAEQVGTSRVRWISRVPLPGRKGEGTATTTRGGSTPVQSPDPSRAGLAAVTMVRGDHVFLERWIDHYAPLAGRENLYVLRHGEDAGVDRIARGANIVNLPLRDDLSGFDRRRWAALSAFSSGLTLYYNWVLCNDVDELVAPDPATGMNLTEYLADLFRRGLAAPVISPFAVEIVHTPATETEPITPGRPILSVRRNFRINSNYAKPCLIRRRVQFSVGGHGSNVPDVRLDPQLWLFHLRYMDDAISTERLLRRRAFVTDKAGSADEAARSTSTWAQGTASFERLRAMIPAAERAEFPEVIDRMLSGRQQAPSTGNWFFGRYRSKELYRLPERFAALL